MTQREDLYSLDLHCGVSTEVVFFFAVTVRFSEMSRLVPRTRRRSCHVTFVFTTRKWRVPANVSPRSL